MQYFVGNNSWSEKFKQYSSLFVILFIQFIYLLKYTERVTDYFIAISVLITTIYAFIYFLRNKINISEVKKSTFIFLIIIAYILVSIILLIKIPQTSLNVDRFSVITSFWDSYFQSKYVYLAKSHLGNVPGPMPFYFILALPFYSINELGYFSLMGLLTFTFILKYAGITSNNRLAGIMLLVSSAFYLWEIISRSNIFLNSSLILLSLLFFIKSLYLNKNKHIFINGIIIGLLLSTRNVLIIPFIVLFLNALRSKTYSIVDTIKISIIILLVFSATFLPFVIHHFQSFLIMNPFIVQSSFLMPSWLSIFCISLTIISLFWAKSYKDVFYFSGLFLFITIFVYLAYQICTRGFQNAYFGNKADISYFILCVPFFLFYILSENISLNPRQKK